MIHSFSKAKADILEKIIISANESIEIYPEDTYGCALVIKTPIKNAYMSKNKGYEYLITIQDAFN